MPDFHVLSSVVPHVCWNFASLLNRNFRQLYLKFSYKIPVVLGRLSIFGQRNFIRVHIQIHPREVRGIFMAKECQYSSPRIRVNVPRTFSIVFSVLVDLGRPLFAKLDVPPGFTIGKTLMTL